MTRSTSGITAGLDEHSKSMAVPLLLAVFGGYDKMVRSARHGWSAGYWHTCLCRLTRLARGP